MNTSRKRNFDAWRSAPADPEGRYSDTTLSRRSPPPGSGPRGRIPRRRSRARPRPASCARTSPCRDSLSSRHRSKTMVALGQYRRSVNCAACAWSPVCKSRRRSVEAAIRTDPWLAAERMPFAFNVTMRMSRDDTSSPRAHPRAWRSGAALACRQGACETAGHHAERLSKRIHRPDPARDRDIPQTSVLPDLRIGGEQLLSYFISLCNLRPLL